MGELWIRTQKRDNLLQIGFINYSNKMLFMEEDRQILMKDGHYLESSGVLLGEYETKERALEVLDEIQKSLYPDIKMLANKIENNEYGDYANLKSIFAVKQPVGTLEIHQLQNIVYEMPAN